jgi:Protein of unknown function (DUF3618)
MISSSSPGAHRAEPVPRTEPSQHAETAPEVEAARERVEQTREELGQTVAALAEKVDVKARTREKINEVSQRARYVADQARHSAQSKAAVFRNRAASTTSGVAAQARRLRPEVRVAAGKAAGTVKGRPSVLAAVAAVLAVVGLALWRRRR